jgi:hypothetical protein
MATSFMSLIRGIGRMSAAPGSSTLYDQQISIISGTAASSNQIKGPVVAGVAVPLPNTQTYTGAELQVTLNGLNLEPVGDYTYSGTGAPFSAVAFTFALVVGDIIDFRIVRGP